MRGGNVVLEPEVWRSHQREHRRAVDELTAGHRARRSRGERHPVWDFMFTYYPVTPGKLGRWNPGAAVSLVADDGDRPGTTGSLREVADRDGTRRWELDAASLAARRGESFRFIRRLLSATLDHTPRFSCFGMHEWAMVYRDEPRHPEPLRLGRTGTDSVVEESTLRCTHIDAFRFFTDEAVPRNTLHPTRRTQVDLEQPGCLHATMDLYKWATKLGPLVPGELWLDTFRLACDVRRTDMEASPYDLREWGFTPVEVETPEGRAEYVRRQRDFADRGQVLRRSLIDRIDTFFDVADPAGDTQKTESGHGTTQRT
ncbi:3-methyladenine DNA glycosylase [Corynebacterium sp.]|uniref:3-methyladenine DNA glycosylase n=1 Tax=Corynebacterium sp. TaxID=1720 RepID=UPI0025C1E7FE|nr:3-methyladenine DNA glycosylase [Corynebacterium sp.]